MSWTSGARLYQLAISLMLLAYRVRCEALRNESCCGRQPNPRGEIKHHVWMNSEKLCTWGSVSEFQWWSDRKKSFYRLLIGFYVGGRKRGDRSLTEKKGGRANYGCGVQFLRNSIYKSS